MNNDKNLKMKRLATPLFLLALLLSGAIALPPKPKLPADPRMLSYTVDLKSQDLQLYWKDEKGEILSSIQNLKTFVESKQRTLVFAMNAGMFNPEHWPQGLFIQQGKKVAPLDTLAGEGNFYLKPNGVFYVKTDSTAAVCPSAAFTDDGQIRYATQSGPMLVIGGAIHPAFKKGSSNLNIRNGVGILPDGRAVFVLSKTAVNFHDFAAYFQGLGCKNALYLDGSISRAYLPEQDWVQLDGVFGVMVGVTKGVRK